MKGNAKKIIYWLLVATVCMGIPGYIWASPSCEVKVKDAGPPLVVEFIFQETQVGLKSIVVKENENFLFADENFFPGTTAPITYTFAQLSGTTEPYAEVEATDMNGRTTICTYPASEPPQPPQAPQCSVAVDSGPPFTVSFSIVDATEGLQSISVEEEINADVDIPPFTVGTTESVIVTAQKMDEFADFRVTLAVSDMDGNQRTCGYDQQAQQDTQDPQVVLTNEAPGPPTTLEITAQDDQSGIQTITTVEAINAEVQIPAFTAGATSPVIITVSQITALFDFSVRIEVVDRGGNKTPFHYQTAINEFRPEIDLVGQDSQYFFEDDWISQIFSNGKDAGGTRINNFSDFQPEERFDTNAGQASADSCYSTSNRTYPSVLTPTWTEAEYAWEIVLQMQPATDLMLGLHVCVLKTGEDDIWTAGFQSGFYTSPWNQQVFLSRANPRLTALALPGPMAKEGFPAAGFILDTRRHSGLQVAPLNDSLITLQALANESVVIALPSHGGLNALGQTTYSLSQGDRIKVIISIPGDTPVDTRFGKDSANLQYIGKKGTEYTTND
jgi:hypothetical protein